MSTILRPLNPQEFNSAYQLLHQAFPPIEHREEPDQRALLRRPEYTMFVRTDEQGEVDALLAAWEMERVRFVEHFAVRDSLRGKGLGAKILQEYLSSSSKPVVLEVEPPETPIAIRRIEFYRRQGLLLNEYPYEQPPLREGMPNCPLLLMSWPQPLSAQEFQIARQSLYQTVYGQS